MQYYLHTVTALQNEEIQEKHSDKADSFTAKLDQLLIQSQDEKKMFQSEP